MVFLSSLSDPNHRGFFSNIFRMLDKSYGMWGGMGHTGSAQDLLMAMYTRHVWQTIWHSTFINIYQSKFRINTSKNKHRGAKEIAQRQDLKV